MTIRKICPECGQQYGTRPAVSRKDRKTEICPDCGTKQALDTVRDLLGPEMTDQQWEGYKSGFLKEILPRTTRRQYIEGKVFSIMVSGFMVWTLSILTVLFINFIVFYPLEIQGAIQKEALLDLLMKAFRTGLIGSIISTFGGSCGILWDSAYMAYGIPFVSFYFGIILHDRYFKNQIWFYPVEWILADENWGPDKIGVWLFLLLFLLVMLGILGGVLYGRLEEI